MYTQIRSYQITINNPVEKDFTNDKKDRIILDKTDANDLISKTAQGRFLTNTDVLFQAYYSDDKKEW